MNKISLKKNTHGFTKIATAIVEDLDAIAYSGWNLSAEGAEGIHAEKNPDRAPVFDSVFPQR
jgi:hypothetical protein